ncbi:MAG TPA: PEP/pyruvate-binding domain-containing protein [Candidatus Polarisedimenticolaceae bacterium]
MSAIPPDAPGVLVLRGRATSPGLACGPLRRNRADAAPKDIEGGILVAERAVPDDVGRILSASGTLTLSGAVLSHVSLLSREFGKPSVALSGGSRARLLAEGDGLLLLEDIVGGSGPAVLVEGDVVLLDGDDGVVRVPGGVDLDERARVRAVHAPLASYATLPDDPNLLQALVVACENPHGAAFSYLLEAALLHRRVPAGPPAKRLIAAFAADPTHAHALGERLAWIRAKVETRAAARCRSAEEAITAAEDLDELERVLRSVERAVERDAAVLEDVDAPTDLLEGGLDPVLKAAAARRDLLRGRIDTEVTEALALDDEALRPRLGGLFRLLRRARAARVSDARLTELHSRLARQLAAERARAGMHLVLPLRADGPRERGLIGGKAAGLLEAARALPPDCRIPPAFVVTASSYRLHLLGETGERLRQATLESADEATLSRRARAALLSGAIPEEVQEAVEQAYLELGEPRVAVRSSATIEDAPMASLAGLFDTYLGVLGLPNVLDRIRWAWASMWNARALAALGAAGMSPLRAAQAILVQQAVETRAAGVLFSRDPAGRADTMLVNATWGLGEGISQGEIAGDLFWVRRSTGDLVATEAGGGTKQIILDPAGLGTVEVPLPRERLGLPCLSTGDLSRLAALAQSLEAATGRAQDVEFGFGPDDELVVFQIRRIVPHRTA